MSPLLRAGAALLAALPAPAQQPPPLEGWELEATLAADPVREGPPALVWLRERWLPTRPGWPEGRDGLQALEVTWRAGTFEFRAPEAAPVDYAEGTVRWDGGVLGFTCGADGLEDWVVPAARRPAGRIGRLLEVLDPGAGGPGMVVAVDALAGNLAAGSPGSTAARLELAAASCGHLAVRSWWNGDELRVRGRSRGGLTLPAVLAVLADGRRTGDPTGEERWLVRAASVRGPERAEAVRQLGRLHSPRARAALEGLLFTADDTRLWAMAALLDSNDPAVLDDVLAAADPDVPGSIALARSAASRAWSGLSAGSRIRLRRSHPELVPTGGSPAGPAGDPRTAGHLTTSARWIALAWILGSSAFCFWLRHRLRGARRGA